MLVFKGEVSTNPFHGHSIHVPVVEKELMTKEDAESLMNTGDEAFNLITTIMACTGMRVGDAVSLTLKNFDLTQKILTFSPDKQKAGREMPLKVPVCEKLAKALAEKGHLLEGTIKTVKPYQTRWNKRVESANLTKGITPHSTRHFFVSLLANEGVSEEMRMKLVGHSSGKSKVHSLYTHLEVESLRKELAKVEWLKG